ncbi:MAG: SGNH/GDSL hydrolase family protein [Myxococcota bacterium]|nr:SGNH/GDSL hydrolase family protein [Myxococcota bacterium]
MVKSVWLWLLTTLLLTTHVVYAWGYYHSSFPPDGWDWDRAELPAHGFIDQDAVRQAHRWVLSHHDRWIGSEQSSLSVKGQLSDGGELQISESMNSVHMICSGELIQLNSSQKLARCSPQMVTTQQCHFQTDWRIDGNEWIWSIDDTVGSCLFDQQADRDKSEYRWRLGSGVRPVWISRINGTPVFDPTVGIYLSVIFGFGLWWIRNSKHISMIFLSSVLSLAIPVLSPELFAVYFRAPAWNHWGLGLYLNLILFLSSFLWQWMSAHSVRLSLTVIGLVSIALALLANNTNPVSIFAFVLCFIMFGLAQKALQTRSTQRLIGALLLSLMCLEWGSRNSATGQRWLRDMGYANATLAALSSEEQGRLIKIQEEHSLFQAAQFQDYPTAAFPVRYPEKGSRPRIVAMGGSSTGGAYQMDDLSRFYPARLAMLLENRFEVLNQGVGGWTSFHIRRYLEHHFSSLKPDILTLYISNNDAAKNLPADIESIYQRMDGQLRPPSSISLLGPLQSVQRLIWLSKRVAAVPPERMGYNIKQIADMMPVETRRILLMTELNHPDSTRLNVHHQRLIMMAEKLDGVEVWDGRMLHSTLDSNYFLDQVHLSDAGHQWLATALADHLGELGWLE